MLSADGVNLQNGVGAFILQCKRLDFHYCNYGGSSRGML
jgi:large subunit ribosomal protein L43